MKRAFTKNKTISHSPSSLPGSGTVTNVISSDGSVTIINGTTTPDLSVALISSGTALLGSLTGANFNTTNDQSITLSGGTSFVITDVLITNVSTNINTAKDAEINSAILRGGYKYFTSITNESTDTLFILESSNNVLNNNSCIQTAISLNETGVGILSIATAGTTVYFSLATPQGAAATADVYIFGYILS